ncbi:TetR/AcrR family transcriptional regulator [Pseudonocardia sp. KRD291]|uniref:TetR/AcrR family transcriptional regulator n=1 Tax=Pseudonocardia sp. KRD291 TaxID=2792007 RepID=UPI001C4A384E|nr:TetR/AcrR family transcriptional regulator [Pseudonocardia sp. KRD291]MBW0102206.1 TetR/AcrR family transcriptional regulator [Pseudonocardia sp. KRD291]
MNAPRTARARARAELTREIVDAARRQLADVGAAGLSLRAVSRELGMVSSALHRYFPTRDDLLTALITEGYDALGDAVQAAEATAPRDDHPARWIAVATAIRTWALAHPHEYALIYGSPVPGYSAPSETTPSAARTVTTLVTVLADAHAAGCLDTPTDAVPAPLDADVARARDALGVDLPDEALLRGVTAWTALFGHVTFELFGQFENVLYERDALFARSATELGRYVGLR